MEYHNMKFHPEPSTEQKQRKHHANLILLMLFFIIIIEGIAFAIAQFYILGDYFDARWEQRFIEVIGK